MRYIIKAVAAAAFTSLAAPAAAQPPAVQTPFEALAQDAAQYAARHNVDLPEAMRRLRAQEESVAASDRIRAEFADRLAGIAIEHRPDYRIVVLLAGDEPVPDRSVLAGGMRVPIHFRVDAAATSREIVEAIRRHQGALRRRFPRAQGMGADPRSGELVLMLRDEDARALDLAQAEAELESIFGVPARIRLVDGPTSDARVEGGARVAGNDSSGRRFYCTTGFIVTDGSRTGVVTAAHCPDELTYFGPDGSNVPLTMVGAWGARYQDVQVHVREDAGEGMDRPLFYADPERRAARTVATWRNRTSTRAGDSVCHRGETTGYSCAEVELVDYAPGGDLCAGPCEPVWVTVTGPSCRSGDSGGPIFNGNTAFGIVKGSSYRSDGSCAFYFYMSTDYLPEGWRLLVG
jgi:hypothetical protein